MKCLFCVSQQSLFALFFVEGGGGFDYLYGKFMVSALQATGGFGQLVRHL